jgi:dolichol-phosphate mannosyltransferase
MNDRDNDGADAIPDFEREGLTAILPAYNEEANIFRAVELVRSALETVTSNYEIIVVDDGSVDKTRAIAGSLEKEDPRVRVIHHERNRGYGAALRSGFAAASKGFCFHTDSDCQFDLSEMREMALAAVDADVVAGYRIHRRDLPHRRLERRRL